MDGILNINKPVGPTSHDIVVRLRRIIHPKRIGHAGTLDPPATGVLLICLDNATRITEYLMDLPKRYRATMVLGAETDTQDQTGSILQEFDCSHVNKDMLDSVLKKFVGTIMQVPPMVSAIHYQGRRLYELARSGKTVERVARPVQVYSIQLVDFKPGSRAEATLDIECSRGTYVRTICADIGRALSCGAYMSSLVRTAIGKFTVDAAVSVEAVEEKVASGKLGEVIIRIDKALEHLPSVKLSSADSRLVVHGSAVPLHRVDLPFTRLTEGLAVRMYDPENRLLGIGVVAVSSKGIHIVKPDKIFVHS